MLLKSSAVYFICTFVFIFQSSMFIVRAIEEKDEKNLLLIYVGGTVGMKPDENGLLAPVPGYLAEVVESLPELKSDQMPNITVVEFDPILDSACMGPSDWVKIAEKVEQEYYNFDGFVVLMGTDTMAYTASALSFMFQDLGKPVILTGSQIPFSEAYNDARRNLIVSIILAARYELNEVCVFFNDRLLRGNRCSKINSFGLDAFDSPNFPPLATIGVNIAQRNDLILPPPKNKFVVHKNVDSNIIVVKLVPGFDDEALMTLARSCSNLKAIVLETYGSGNMQVKEDSFLNFIKLAKEKGILIVSATQCKKGCALTNMYASGSELSKVGVLTAGDMTTEAVVTKLAYLFGRIKDPKDVAIHFEKNLRGEISAKEFYTTKLSTLSIFSKQSFL